MISARVGDLLAQDDITHIAHQVNLYHTFGAGLAAQIARRFPYAEIADNDTDFANNAKIGTFSIGRGVGLTVINLYTQRSPEDGYAECLTDYNSMRVALRGVEEYLRDGKDTVRLGLPHGLGCGLAGGSWPKVYGIIKEFFAESPVDVVIVKLPTEI